jgi:hexulose-6-phosphate isomerase
LEFKTLLERLEPEIYGLYLDVANTLPHSLAEHWIRIFRERIFALHAKDLDLSSMRFGPPLTGNVNWPEIKRALEEIGYRLPHIQEILSNPLKTLSPPLKRQVGSHKGKCLDLPQAHFC